jgi:hypothetical protein
VGYLRSSRRISICYAGIPFSFFFLRFIHVALVRGVVVGGYIYCMMWAFYFQNISLMGAGSDNDLNEKKWFLSVIFDQMDGYSEMSTSRARRFQALNQKIYH